MTLARLVNCGSFSVSLREELDRHLAKVKRRCAGDSFVGKPRRNRFKHKSSETRINYHAAKTPADKREDQKKQTLIVGLKAEQGANDPRKLRADARQWLTV